MTVQEKLIKAMAKLSIRKTAAQLAKSIRGNANTVRRELGALCRKRKASHKRGEGYLLRKRAA